MRRTLIKWIGLVLLLFIGFLLWRSRADLPIQQTFTLRTRSDGSLQCLVVRPAAAQPCPVVIYAHAAGGSLSNDLPALHQLAGLGLATVSLHYNQTNLAAFHARFGALLDYLNQQPWVKTNAMIWMGLSLGANHLMDEALRHAEPDPQILVLFSSQGFSGSFTHRRLAPFHSPVLLLQGREDQLFPWTNAARLFTELTAEGVPASLKVIPGVGHGLEPDREVIYRSVGEFCLAELAGANWWRDFHPPETPANRARWWCWLPAGLWLLAWKLSGRRKKSPAVSAPSAGTQTSEALPAPGDGAVRRSQPVTLGMWVFATLLVAWVLAVTFIYIVTPQLPASPLTLALARHWIVPPSERDDFDYLARQPAWAGKPVKACLEQIEWSGYARRRFNLRGDDALYRDYCVSPFITGRPGESVNWRPALWAEFEPLTGAETDPAAAAVRIARHLRENVVVVKGPGVPEDVSGIWGRRVTDLAGFETTYVAALRATGIPAGLDANHRPVLWNGTRWQTAPSPALMDW